MGLNKMNIFSIFKKKERTLGDFDNLSLSKIDGELIENYRFKSVDVKPLCPTCRSDNLTEVFPRVEMNGMVLHTCLDCQERCYL